MKKIILLCFLSLAGCETYIPAQDVYYTPVADTVTQQTTVYTQPTTTYVQPATETTVYTTYQPQTIYVTEQQPAASVIYVEEPVYYHPAPLPAPRPPFPPHHFEPAPPHHFEPAPPPHFEPAPPAPHRPPHHRR